MDVKGNLYTPRTGVGTCTASAVDALDSSGHATVSGSTVQLPTAVSYPTPQIPAPSPVAASELQYGRTRATVRRSRTDRGTNCSVSGEQAITINGHGTTLSLPSVSLASHINIVLVASSPPAQYNFNSISRQWRLDSRASAPLGATQAVLVDVVGLNPRPDPNRDADRHGGRHVRSGQRVRHLLELRRVDAAVHLRGNGHRQHGRATAVAAATFYAPNATVNFRERRICTDPSWRRRIDNVGNGNIHYDRRLQHDFYVAGHPMSGTFTWKRY